MPIALITFYILAGIIVSSALLVVSRKNAISSALFLAASLIAVAGLYVSVRAEFLFAAQILVYTGGVMVLFLFVIMLVNDDDLVAVRSVVKRWWSPVALVTFTFAILVMRARTGEVAELRGGFDPLVASNTRAIAEVLFTSYLLPFEIVSFLLLVAMVGAIVLSKKEI